MDSYQAVRSIPFPALCEALGIPFTFKTRKSGSEWFGRCPLHEAKTNNTSFSFNADGRYNCFSCSAKGRGAIDFTRAFRSAGFKDAVDLLGGIVPQTKKTPPEAIAGSPGGITRRGLPLEKDSWKKFPVACPWLEQRIPDAAVRERYGVFCYDNPTRPKSSYRGRVMIPIKDLEGRLYGYLGRAVHNPDSSDEHDQLNIPKYLFPKNLPKSHFLFGAAELKDQAPVKVLYLVESPFSVMKFASMGLACVAAYGWSVSEEQIQLLTTLAKGIVYLPDKNKRQESGVHVATLAAHMWVRFPELPEGCDDPEHLSREQVLSL